MASTPTLHAPGIYLGLPFQEYLADPALSKSGIQNLRVSPLTYWVKSVLNPDYAPDESEAKDRGTAFHTRILEGKEAFLAAYAPEISSSDYPDALKSGEDLRAACDSLGLKKSGTLAEMSARIRMADKDLHLWVEIEHAYLKAHEGKSFLPASTISQIELAAAAIESSQELATLFSGGFPEVSVFWIDPTTGVRMKARLDYLTLSTITELKTFSNQKAKPLNQAVTSAIAERGYGIGAVTYLEAVAQAKLMLQERGMEAVQFGESLIGAPFDFDAWFGKLAKVREHRLVFVFQETGRVPNVAIREFKPACSAGLNNYYSIWKLQYEAALMHYRDCAQRFGDQPWVESASVESLEDEDFPAWAFN